MGIILDTLGSIGLRLEDDQELTGILAQPKRFALLAFLAVEFPGGMCQRETLVAVFWPAAGDRRGRNALSQGLAFLRNHLPPDTIRTRGPGEIGIHEGLISADVSKFLNACSEQRWADALDLYAGDFLRGFHVKGASGFDDWIFARRQALREEAVHAAWSLAEEQICRGALLEAERTGLRALRMDYPAEASVRDFLAALAAAGDRAAAVRFFQRFDSRLRRDFQLDPSAETLALIQQIRETGLASAPSYLRA